MPAANRPFKASRLLHIQVVTKYRSHFISTALIKTAGFKVWGDRGYFLKNIFLKLIIVFTVPRANYVYETVSRQVSTAADIMRGLYIISKYLLLMVFTYGMECLRYFFSFLSLID
jgi:hypothetical protein